MPQFKFVAIPMGSGWLSGHVAVEQYFQWPEQDKERNLCLNFDTQDFEEFSAEIDRLIDELEGIRELGRSHFGRQKYSRK